MSLSKGLVLLVVAIVVVLIVGILLVSQRLGTGGRANKSISSSDVLAPSIVNGELMLPKVVSGSSQNANNLAFLTRLGVISANLIGILDQSQKLTAIRIIGEATNPGGKTVDSVSSVVRFFDSSGKVVGQKIGHWSAGFDFFGVTPGDKTYYDVTVDNPPVSDKLEIVLNVSSATDSAVFEPLKVSDRSIEVKTAVYQSGQRSAGSGQPFDSAQGKQSGTQSGESTASAQATPSPSTSSGQAGDQIEYYTVTGKVVNTLPNPVSDISVYVWVKDSENKVFSFARQDFKNDLLIAGNSLDFRINLLPFKANEKRDSYEVAVFGKEYRLTL